MKLAKTMLNLKLCFKLKVYGSALDANKDPTRHIQMGLEMGNCQVHTGENLKCRALPWLAMSNILYS